MQDINCCFNCGKVASSMATCACCGHAWCVTHATAGMLIDIDA